MPPGRFACDIDPQGDGIVKLDFFDFELPYDDRVVVVGNPPFGRNSSLAIRFFNKAACGAEIIAFIVPRSFKKVRPVGPPTMRADRPCPSLLGPDVRGMGARRHPACARLDSLHEIVWMYTTWYQAVVCRSNGRTRRARWSGRALSGPRPDLLGACGIRRRGAGLQPCGGSRAHGAERAARS